MKKTLFFVSVITLSVLHLYCSSPVFAAQATLAWNPPTTNADGTLLTDLAGFKVYYGTTSRIYTTSVDVGNVSSFTVAGLADGPMYYFVVTAYDNVRNESIYSTEVAKATQAPQQFYTIAVVKTGSGTGTVTATGINCGNDCSELLAAGTAVALSAQPSPSSSFGGWSGGGCSGSANCVITVQANTSVTATFNPVSQPQFLDVPPTYWAESYIAMLASSGITAGCGGGNYCPENLVTRSQMAVFVTRALGENPATACTGAVFGDVNAAVVGGEAFCRYIEKFGDLGITSGCVADDPATPQNERMYCPDELVTRAQMAVFLERALGVAQPPPCTGAVFSDVTAAALGDATCGYVEALADLGVTSGCQADDPATRRRNEARFCPSDPITRAQMAVFLVNAPAPLMP